MFYLFCLVAIGIITWNVVYKLRHGKFPDPPKDDFTRDYLGRPSSDLRPGSLRNNLSDDLYP